MMYMTITIVIISSFIFGTTSALADCYPDLPNPNLAFVGTEDYIGSDGNPYTRYRLTVTNWSIYPNELFESSPDLPPCGLNPNASRTWVYIYNADNSSHIYGFCALNSPEGLAGIWFGLPQGSTPPAGVYITLTDRRCNITYTSNIADLSSTRDYHALIVGVADYPGTINDLNYPDDDANDMMNALLGYPNWEWSNIQLLLDSNATKTNISNAINLWNTQADQDDVCVFFFSGHGTNGTDVAPIDELDGVDEYLCAYDSNIRDDELSNWLAALPTTNVIVILDACYSGGEIRSSERSDGIAKVLPGTAHRVLRDDGFAADLKRKRAKDMDDNPGCVVITATEDDELSWEFPLINNGLFTYFAVAAINAFADRNGNGELSAEEVGIGTRLIFYRLYINNPWLYPILQQVPQLYDDYPVGNPNSDELTLCMP